MAPRQLRLEPIEVDSTADKGAKRVRVDSADWVEWEKFLRACMSSSCKVLILAVSIGAGPTTVRALCVMRMEFFILVMGDCLSLNSFDSHKRKVATADFAAAHPFA
eukprot:scaffold5447_cov110-Isochrysis_galbana.AAC.2